MLGRAGKVDDLPVGEFQGVLSGSVEELGPGALAVPAAHGRPHGGRQGAHQSGEGAVLGRAPVEVLDALSELGGVLAPERVAADAEQAGDPAGEEAEGPLAGGEAEGLERDLVAFGVGVELQVAAADELGQPLVGAAQVEDEDRGA